MRPELWAALERYTIVCYLHNLSLHSVLQVNTSVDKEFILCKGNVHVGPSFVKFTLLQQTLQLLSCGWIHCSVCQNTGRSLTCDMRGSWSCKLDTGCLNFTNLKPVSNTNQRDFQLPNDNKMTMPTKQEQEKWKPVSWANFNFNSVKVLNVLTVIYLHTHFFVSVCVCVCVCIYIYRHLRGKRQYTSPHCCWWMTGLKFWSYDQVSIHSMKPFAEPVSPFQEDMLTQYFWFYMLLH